MNKINYFTQEFKYVKDKNLRKDLRYLVGLLPDYFFEIPAASTGKYHPAYAQGKHGLVRHTKAAVRIAYEFFQDEAICKFSAKEQDLIIIALVLHDGLKSGKVQEKYTRFDHPLLVSKLIMEQKENLTMEVDDIRLVCSAIESHMGPWNVDYKTKKEVLPKPKTAMERFVHMCDYLASRKVIEMKFNGNEIVD